MSLLPLHLVQCGRYGKGLGKTNTIISVALKLRSLHFTHPVTCRIAVL